MWRSIPCSMRELRIDITLACGQSFRWTEGPRGQWTSVLAGHVWVLKQNDEELLYQVLDATAPKEKFKETSVAEKILQLSRQPGNASDEAGDKLSVTTHCEDVASEHKSFLHLNHASTGDKTFSNRSIDTQDQFPAILRDYFQLHVDLESLYKQWSEADINFQKKAKNFTGVRILRQDPVENLFSFICSSNNNISRISGMVDRMCAKFGKEVLKVEGKPYYTFPTVNSLAASGVEETLRDLGFGYRAKFIARSAKYIQAQKDGDWLHNLREKPYQEAKDELMQLCGVGAKVADCVCLMSLDKPGAIPVDTHVWQIAARDYLPSLTKGKSLTDRLYREIGDHFRGLWGEYAGWAHSVLFSAELKKFEELTDKRKTKKPVGDASTSHAKKKKTKR